MRRLMLQQIIGKYVASDPSLCQAYLARRIHVDPSTVSRHLNGETAMTLDQFTDYIREIKSPELVFELLAALMGEIMGELPVMNNIDESFPAVVAKAAEELGEGMEACLILQKSLCNVSNPGRFANLPEAVRSQIRERLAQAIADVYYALQQMICTTDHSLGVHPAEYFGITVRKLIDRGYVTSRNGMSVGA